MQRRKRKKYQDDRIWFRAGSQLKADCAELDIDVSLVCRTALEDAVALWRENGITKSRQMFPEIFSKPRKKKTR